MFAARLIFFLFGALGGLCAQGSSFIYLNGGAIPFQNFEKHEVDMASWLRLLEPDPKRSVILNAGGKDTPYVPVDERGLELRNVDGSPRLLTSKFKENFPQFEIQSASATHFEKALSQLRKNHPEQSLTLIIGDHGGEQGISLWKEAPYTQTQLSQALSKEVPKVDRNNKEIFTRSLHLQCFAWSHIQSPQRPDLKNVGELSDYLAREFPPERCALALSLPDEKSRYYAIRDSEDNFWGHMGKNIKKPLSLEEVQKYLVNSDYSYPTPSLTSEFFISSIVNFYRDQSQRQNSKVDQAHLSGNTSSQASRIPEELANLYGSAKLEEAAKQSARISQLNLINNESQATIGTLVIEYTRQKNPEFFKKVLEPSLGQTQVNDAIIENYTKVTHAPDFSDFSKTAIKKIPSILSPFPELRAYIQQHDLEPDMKAVQESVDMEIVKAQLDRKKALAELRDERKQPVEKWLKRPENKELLAQYQKLRRCEKSAL